MTDRLTDETVLALAKTPEFRAELAVREAKTPVSLVALIAEAIRDAVKEERAAVDQIMADLYKDCFCAERDGESGPCEQCYNAARIRGMLKGRAEL